MHTKLPGNGTTAVKDRFAQCEYEQREYYLVIPLTAAGLSFNALTMRQPKPPQAVPRGHSDERESDEKNPERKSDGFVVTIIERDQFRTPSPRPQRPITHTRQTLSSPYPIQQPQESGAEMDGLDHRPSPLSPSTAPMVSPSFRTLLFAELPTGLLDSSPVSSAASTPARCRSRWADFSPAPSSRAGSPISTCTTISEGLADEEWQEMWAEEDAMDDEQMFDEWSAQLDQIWAAAAEGLVLELDDGDRDLPEADWAADWAEQEIREEAQFNAWIARLSTGREEEEEDEEEDIMEEEEEEYDDDDQRTELAEQDAWEQPLQFSAAVQRVLSELIANGNVRDEEDVVEVDDNEARHTELPDQSAWWRPLEFSDRGRQLVNELATGGTARDGEVINHWDADLWEQQQVAELTEQDVSDEEFINTSCAQLREMAALSFEMP